jgi:hypothetical protein
MVFFTRKPSNGELNLKKASTTGTAQRRQLRTYRDGGLSIGIQLKQLQVDNNTTA